MFNRLIQKLALISLLLPTAASFAVEGGQDCHPNLWNEVKKLALQYGDTNPSHQFEILSVDQARFELQGHAYTAELFDSEYSDGGDLNDVVATRDDGQCVLNLQAVPAFGNIYKAFEWIEISPE